MLKSFSRLIFILAVTNIFCGNKSKILKEEDRNVQSVLSFFIYFLIGY